MIRGYARSASVFPGTTLTLHVSTDSPRFRLEFFRQGTELVRVEGADSQPLTGVACPDGPPDEDWSWPAYRVAIPAHWPSGAYVVTLVEITEGGERRPDMTTADGTNARALFVVRSAFPEQSGSILYKLSWATYHAYNATGYGSLYAEAMWSREYPTPGFKVTTRRPGGGTGGRVEPGDPVDAHEGSSRRQTFAHWDAPFISWLEENGYVLDYCTDFDLHRDPDLLAPYHLMLSVGHDEYWSEEMRSQVERFVKAGGNVAYFSGNISAWRIHFVDDDTAIVCAKVPPTSRDTDQWAPDQWWKVDPESRMTAVSVHNAGGWWNGRRDPLGYTVQHAGHWVYEGTGLSDGDVFGDDAELPLIGYECDGAKYTRHGQVATATGEDGTPRDFTILGVAELTDGWSAYRPQAAATMGVFARPGGGIVFQGATTDWPLLVSRNPHVERITRNVVDRLRLSTTRVLGPLPTRGGRMLAAGGQTVSFCADVAALDRSEPLEIDWRVSGGTVVSTAGPVVRVTTPSRPAPVTVSVVVSDAVGELGFGSRTFVPLTSVESLQLEACILLREMVMPGEPSSPWVLPTEDPLTRIGDVIPVRLPWLRDRARRLAQVADHLIEHLGEDGQPPPAARGHNHPVDMTRRDIR